MPQNALAPTPANSLRTRGNTVAPMSPFDRALQDYPYLQDKNLYGVVTPNPKESRLLEFYPPDEPGAPQSPRPKQLPGFLGHNRIREEGCAGFQTLHR